MPFTFQRLSPAILKGSVPSFVTLGLALCAFAQSGDPSSTGGCVGNWEPPSTEAVLREFHGFKGKPESLGTVEASTLGVAQTFHGNWLQDRKGTLQSAGTVRHGSEDVLWARWASPPGNPLIKNIQMWDGALYELVIFEVAPSVIASDDTVRNFLLTITKPPPKDLRISGPTARELEDGFGFRRLRTEGRVKWRGVMLRMPISQAAGLDQQGFEFYKIRRRVFVIFNFGKRAAYTKWPQSIDLGDRFPSFATLVEKWPKERVLQELTKPEDRRPCRVVTYADYFRSSFRLDRDLVFIAELVRRGIDDAEFQRVMNSPNGLEFISEAFRTGKLDKYAGDILETMHRFQDLPDVNIRDTVPGKGESVRSNLASLIGHLPMEGGPDFSGAMVELIGAGREPESALNYLSWRLISHKNAVNPEIADKLEAAKVPGSLENRKRQVVEEIRSQSRAR